MPDLNLMGFIMCYLFFFKKFGLSWAQQKLGKEPTTRYTCGPVSCMQWLFVYIMYWRWRERERDRERENAHRNVLLLYLIYVYTYTKIQIYIYTYIHIYVCVVYCVYTYFDQHCLLLARWLAIFSPCRGVKFSLVPAPKSPESDSLKYPYCFIYDIYTYIYIWNICNGFCRLNDMV